MLIFQCWRLSTEQEKLLQIASMSLILYSLYITVLNGTRLVKFTCLLLDSELDKIWLTSSGTSINTLRIHDSHIYERSIWNSSKLGHKRTVLVARRAIERHRGTSDALSRIGHTIYLLKITTLMVTVCNHIS